MTHATRTLLGGAAASTLTSPFTAAIPGPGGQFSVTAATGWPSANFVVVIDRGTATEEKVLVSARSGTTCTIGTAGRAYDGTTAYPHLTTSAVIEPADDTILLTALLEHVNTDAALDHAGYLKVSAGAKLADLHTLAQGQSADPGATGRWADAAHTHSFPAPPVLYTAAVNTAQSINSGVMTAVTGWNSPATVDTSTGLGASSGRYTIPGGWDGDWRFAAAVEFAASATGYRQILIRKNGVAVTGDYLGRQVMAVSTAATTTLVTVAGLIPGLIAGDYLQVMAFHNAGSGLTVGQNTLSTWFTARWSRPT